MKENRSIPTSRMENLPEEASKRGDDNEHMVLQALNRHGHNIVPMVFNREERKLVRHHLMDELEQGFDHRRRALGLVLETRLHAIREACNHVLVTGKTQLRQQRMEHFGRVYRHVAHELDQLSAEFLTDIDQRFENLEQYKTQCIRDREKKRLEKAVDDFLNTLDQLMEEFRHIVSENVDHNMVV